MQINHIIAYIVTATHSYRNAKHSVFPKLVFDFYELDVCLHTKQQASKNTGMVASDSVGLRFGTNLPNLELQR